MQTPTVLIMTPLKLEYEAVSRHLTGKQSVVKEGAAYETGRFQGKHCTYQVVVAEPGMKNIDMALATERAIRLFQPQLALLIGIAGWLRSNLIYHQKSIEKCNCFPFKLDSTNIYN